MPTDGFQGLEKALRDGYRVEVLRDYFNNFIESRLYQPISLISRLWDQVKSGYGCLPFYLTNPSKLRDSMEERERTSREFQSIVIGVSPISAQAALETCGIVYARDGKDSRKGLGSDGRIYGDHGPIDILSVFVKGRGVITGGFARGLFHFEMGNRSSPNCRRFKQVVPAKFSADTFSKAYSGLNDLYMKKLPAGLSKGSVEDLIRLLSCRLDNIDGGWPAEAERLYDLLIRA